MRARSSSLVARSEAFSETTFNEVVGEVPTRSFAAEGLSGSGRSLVELFVESGLCPSKGQARKDLEGGGLYLNNERITRIITNGDSGGLLFGRHLLLRKGRRNLRRAVGIHRRMIHPAPGHFFLFLFVLLFRRRGVGPWPGVRRLC